MIVNAYYNSIFVVFKSILTNQLRINKNHMGLIPNSQSCIWLDILTSRICIFGKGIYLSLFDLDRAKINALVWYYFFIYERLIFSIELISYWYLLLLLFTIVWFKNISIFSLFYRFFSISFFLFLIEVYRSSFCRIILLVSLSLLDSFSSDFYLLSDYVLILEIRKNFLD